MTGMSKTLHPLHNPKSEDYVEASKWCITRDDLDVFEHEVRRAWRHGEIPPDPDPACRTKEVDDLVGPSMYRVNDYYIKKRTAAEGGMSWALMRHPKGLQCDVFATHAWKEGVFEFVERVRSAWPADANHLYVCFLGNPQNGDISEMLSGDVLESPFAKALGTAKYMIVIPNKTSSIYERLWCVLEAYLAVTAAKERGLVITIPIAVRAEFWAELMLPGLVLLAAGLLLGYIVLSATLGYYFGPLSWQLQTLAFCELLWLSLRLLQQHLGCNVRRAAWSDVAVATIGLFFVGIAAGIGMWQLQTFDSRHTYIDVHEEPVIIQKGQKGPVALVTFAIVLLHVYDIGLAISNAVLKLEDAKLEFTTVRDAVCFDPEDAKKIKTLLGIYENDVCGDSPVCVQSRRDHAAEVDQAIQRLKSIGRYDSDVEYNLSKGMCTALAREGINPCKVVCALFLWVFYWVVDVTAFLEESVEFSLGELSTNMHLSIVLEIVLALVCLYVVYSIGERAVFAIYVAFWFGFAFAYVSLLDFYWVHLFKVRGSMWRATAGLQFCMFLAMLLVDAYFYAGFHSEYCNGTCDCTDQRRVVDNDDENFGLKPLHDHFGKSYNTLDESSP